MDVSALFAISMIRAAVGIVVAALAGVADPAQAQNLVEVKIGTNNVVSDGLFRHILQPRIQISARELQVLLELVLLRTRRHVEQFQQADTITVQWPGGRTESWRNVAAGRLVRLVEGTGAGG